MKYIIFAALSAGALAGFLLRPEAEVETGRVAPFPCGGYLSNNPCGDDCRCGPACRCGFEEWLRQKGETP